MASTHTSNLNLEKPALGDQSGEWGTTVNSNMELIDAAVNAKIPKTDLLDEDNMASNSATKPASQQSIKAYVDGASVNQEQVEDIVGGMLDGDETFITVTYDDTDGNIDFTCCILFKQSSLSKIEYVAPFVFKTKAGCFFLFANAS